MPYDLDIAKLDSGILADGTNLAAVQAVVPQDFEEEEVEQFGNIDVYQALGITSVPWPADEDGHAEGVIVRDIGGVDGVVVGARDERASSVYGSLQSGDTALHSTDPDASAQVQAKANRQVMLATKDTEGNNVIHVLDGKNDKIQIGAFGGLIEMTKDGITLACPGGGCTIMMSGDTISLVGTVMLGGTVPVASVASWVSGGIPSVPGATPFNPAPNVFVGAV